MYGGKALLLLAVGIRPDGTTSDGREHFGDSFGCTQTEPSRDHEDAKLPSVCVSWTVPRAIGHPEYEKGGSCLATGGGPSEVPLIHFGGDTHAYREFHDIWKVRDFKIAEPILGDIAHSRLDLAGVHLHKSAFPTTETCRRRAPENPYQV